MFIRALHPTLEKYLQTHGLGAKFNKKKALFENNPYHPGLNVELMAPKHLRIFSFRIDKKYRAIFIYDDIGAVDIIDINNHYQ